MLVHYKQKVTNLSLVLKEKIRETQNSKDRLKKRVKRKSEKDPNFTFWKQWNGWSPPPRYGWIRKTLMNKECIFIFIEKEEKKSEKRKRVP